LQFRPKFTQVGVFGFEMNHLATLVHGAAGAQFRSLRSGATFFVECQVVERQNVDF
jgi:hypothetical protein